MRIKTICLFFVALCICVQPSAVFSANNEVDSDGDGLTDFHEVHKYLTDPNNADSDGDGIPDGDWNERREFQYTVRSVVQVIRPVTPKFLNDDYQDVKVRNDTDWYVELEVVHYPFNKVADSISSSQTWRQDAKSNEELNKWLQPGPSSNWDRSLQQMMSAELKTLGIDINELSDKQAAEKLSKWLIERTQYHNGFSTFITAFDENGQPYIPEGLNEARDPNEKFTFEEQWDREILAKEMFKNKMRGSCSSSAIYLNGCLRAAGLPTRTILCIPVIDANDEAEWEMLKNIKNETVRQRLKSALTPLRGKWASHTFNEVYVGGRWQRLNYTKLGQNIYDRNLFGLMTHVATFHDWADAKMYETIGNRNVQQLKNVSGTANPYSAIEISDHYGEHCKVNIPDINTRIADVRKIHWTDSPELDKDIRQNCRNAGRFGLIAEVEDFESMADVNEFLTGADLRVYLEPVDGIKPNNQNIGIGFEKGCYWLKNGTLKIYLPFGPTDKKTLRKGAQYVFAPRNDNDNYKWESDLRIRR